MDFLKKIPFLVSSSMTIIVGLAGYIMQLENQKLYLTVALTMIISYVAGIILKNTLVSIKEELSSKNEDSENQNLKGQNIDIKIDG